MVTELRIAAPHEEAWINERYAEIGFVLSDLATHLVVIAEIDGVAAGMGRLVPAGDRAYELGGMLVFEQFRGRGIARAIIEELLQHAGAREIYCIPFAELEPIYASAGFVTREPHEALPEGVREKLEWCAREIPHRPVLLMQLGR